MNTVWQFAVSGSLKFGRGSRFELAEELKKRQLEKPLIVSDATLCELPLVKEFLQSLPSYTLFAEGRAEPNVSVAESAIAVGKSGGVDCVIGLGGGSNMDVAKVAATVLQHGGHPQDYFGFDRITSATLPVFALPTTAGTGSEVSHSAVLTDPEAGVKVSTLSQWLRPTVAIVDPALTDSCPKRVTAESGIDALVHAIEAFTNRDFREMTGVDPQARAYEGSYSLTRLLAEEAIRLVGNSLVMLCDEPFEALRDDMALAATLAGMAFSNSGVGIVHALEYPVGALTHCGHGEGNGLLLPHVMRYNLEYRQPKFAKIALLLGASPSGSTESLANEAIEKVCDIQSRVGIRTRLRDLGMTEADIPSVASKAFAIKRLMDINPRTPSVSDLEGILAAAY